MGDLIKSSHSELHAFLELLDALGVKPEELASFRSAGPGAWGGRTLGKVLAIDPMTWAALALGDTLKKYGVTPAELDAVQTDDTRMHTLVAMLKTEAPVVAKPKWREENNVIYFTLPPTDGTTGEQWITRLEEKGCKVWDSAKNFLDSPSFTSTRGVTYEVAVLKGVTFSDTGRISKNIYRDARKRKWIDLHAEAACLIREMFSDEELAEMGLWGIVAMSGGAHLLYADRYGAGRRLDAYADAPRVRWRRDDGFAFALAQA